MEISAHNQLNGTVQSVKSDAVMAEITVNVEAGWSPRPSLIHLASAWTSRTGTRYL
jgi:molybdopterin-binding protein